ncbi:MULTISPECIES: hypothetical protein [Corallincola]|uniref:Uncharacterized protein n=3 Tax=Corallincola TaxID=1775176 RepID=A0A368NPZ4_9GAMM|nr:MULTISPECIES: hypothetical protein [Corallincola]RCU51539.1 hypothetical protein DU002_03450 [Corallincola holothuriorum]TAA47040.1 hypothetical protein EXY25_07280 [Corallincola spongiicola]TCI04693.1 hypothetical protein EZV61_01600 [Corallincola luteus]
MKKIVLVMIAVMLSFSAHADADKGKKYYLKYLRPYFEINGQEFASEHLKVEWKRFFKNDGKKFIKKFSKQYPQAQEFLESDTFQKIAPDVADFAIKYAADSGELADCN